MVLSMRGKTQLHETETLRAGPDKRMAEMSELDYLTGILKKSAAESERSACALRCGPPESDQ